MDYKGRIIEESLEDKSVLKEVKVLSTKVEPVKPENRTPWLKKWTLHEVEVGEDRIGVIIEKISRSFDSLHGCSWYTDLKDRQWHYIIFPHKIFKIDRTEPEGYNDARRYGISLGIPEHQLDFSPDIK